jgi:glycosyltransferase involved in cell wall biosynthesis
MRRLRYAPALRDRVAFLGYRNALKKALSEDRIDVIYNQEIWTPRFDLLVENLKIPIVGGDQGAIYADWMEPAKRRSFKKAAKLICQSLTGLERAKAFGGDAVLMYNGVNTAFFSPPASTAPRPRTILAVGRFVEAQKRFSDLLQAMCLLPDFSLTLVGSGLDEAKLKKLATDLGIADRVRFAGFVSSREQLRTLYQECGVFVSTSSWEAVALVLLEAMSCAAPVVATRIPSFEDLLQNEFDGLLVPVGAPEVVADAVQKAFDQQHQLGLNARKTVEERYSSEALYGRLSRLIETLESPVDPQRAKRIDARAKPEPNL